MYIPQMIIPVSVTLIFILTACFMYDAQGTATGLVSYLAVAHGCDTLMPRWFGHDRR